MFTIYFIHNSLQCNNEYLQKLGNRWKRGNWNNSLKGYWHRRGWKCSYILWI